MKVHADEPVRQATDTSEADYELALASVTTPEKKARKRFTIQHI